MKKSAARVLAKLNGQPTYVPEAPCARGHLLRSTSGGTCVECRRMTENKRVQENRDAYNARKRREREDKKEHLAKKAREIRAQESPEKREQRLEKARVKQRIWRAQNTDRLPNKSASKIRI